MNINQLRYIIAIDKHKHFTRAAENCDIAQSTLSREVQKLESELEVMIFDRSRTPVLPTQKGKDLLKIANNILHKIEAFEITARSSKQNKIESFNLGIWSCISPYILPVFLEKFMKKHSHIRLNIYELSLQEIQESWLNDSLDGCLVPDLIKKQGFYESLIYEEEFMIYRKSSSKKKLEDININSFKSPGTIIQNDLRFIFEKLIPDEFLSEIKLRNQHLHTYQKSSIETIRKIVDYSGGMTLLPKSILNNNENIKSNISKHFLNFSYKTNINFVSPRVFEKKEIINLIKIEFKGLMKNIHH